MPYFSVLSISLFLCFCIESFAATPATSAASTTELLKSASALGQAQASYAKQDYKAAINILEREVELQPECAVLHHWLGKAYGRRAQQAVWLRAIGFAKKTRVHFERAVELDPQNADAMQDLFEYYLKAPGFLGGGIKKAEALALRLAQLDPERGQLAQRKLAEQDR